MARFGSLGTQYFDNSGEPLIDGLIYFYESGTTTPKDTYSNIGETIPNTNPVVLSASGRQPNVFFSGSAKAVLATRDDVIIETRDPVGATSGDSQFDAWSAAVIYSIPNIVEREGNYYISIQDDNQGFDPAGSPEYWTMIDFIRVWNSDETYQINSIVRGDDGIIYRGTSEDNLGNDPVADVTGADWLAAGQKLTTKGSILAGDGTKALPLAPGTNNQVLTADSSQPLGVRWSLISESIKSRSVITESGDWDKPVDGTLALIQCWGAGGGGGSGRLQATSADRNGGSGGGGGAYRETYVLLADLTDPVAATIGAGGAGGAGVSGMDTTTAGNPGGNGGATSFGSFLSSYGGGGGLGGVSTDPLAGGGYGGQLASAVGSTDGGPAAADGIFSASGGDASFGAGNEGNCAATGGSGGGAGGGGSTPLSSIFAGGAGGSPSSGALTGGGGTAGAAGVSPGADGGDGGVGGDFEGGGGGGGANLGNAGDGGGGGISAGGGGGGSATCFGVTVTTGAGGDGGDGLIIVTVW